MHRARVSHGLPSNSGRHHFRLLMSFKMAMSRTMTYQRDPETESDIDTRREPVGRTGGANMRWSPIALTLVVLLVLVAGWAWLASRAGPGNNPTTTTSSDRATDPNMTLKQPGN